MSTAAVSTKPIIIGKIGAAHGLRGWVKITSYTETPEAILNYQPWQIRLGKQPWQQVKVVEQRINDKQVLVRLDDCSDRDSARALTNATIGIDRSQLNTLTEDDCYYWADLEGCSVTTDQGEALGIVDQVFETGSNDVLVVKSDEAEHLIPFLNDVIQDVDLEVKTIIVHWELEP